MNIAMKEKNDNTVDSKKKKGFQMPCGWMILVSILAMIISPFICDFAHTMAVTFIAVHVIAIAYAILACKEIEKCAGHMHWF